MNVSLYLPEPLVKAVQRRAQTEGRSMSNMVGRLLAQAMGAAARQIDIEEVTQGDAKRRGAQRRRR